MLQEIRVVLHFPYIFGPLREVREVLDGFLSHGWSGTLVGCIELVGFADDVGRCVEGVERKDVVDDVVLLIRSAVAHITWLPSERG